jgi:hypothetical protein
VGMREVARVRVIWSTTYTIYTTALASLAGGFSGGAGGAGPGAAKAPEPVVEVPRVRVGGCATGTAEEGGDILAARVGQTQLICRGEAQEVAGVLVVAGVVVGRLTLSVGVVCLRMVMKRWCRG